MSIKVENISFTYMPGTAYEQQALKDISLEIPTGKIVGIIGHTGSGKSTLIQTFNGLVKPTKGKVSIEDVDIAGNTDSARSAKLSVGMVFQYPEHQLFAETVFEDVAFGPRNLGLTAEEIEQRVDQALTFVGLEPEDFKSRSPFALSGGQMRRVAIAGVLAMQPRYLVMDEPSAGLDPASRREFFHQIVEMHHETKATVVLVTHNMDEIVRLADYIYVLHKGSIYMEGTPQDIFSTENNLHEVGIEPPEIMKIMQEIRKQGLAVRTNIYELEDAVRELLGLRSRR